MKDNNNTKYRIIIEKISKESWTTPDGDVIHKSSPMGGMDIEVTSFINKHNETKFEYDGYWLDKTDGMRYTKHSFKGFVESWIAHPVLFVLYKILFKEMNQWINEAKWDY